MSINEHSPSSIVDTMSIPIAGKNVSTLSSKLAIALSVFISTSVAAEWDYRGNISLDVQAFTATADHTASQSSNVSISAEAELYKAFGGNHSVVVTPFLRIDEHDSERTHVDLREALYQYSASEWEFRMGLGKIFWGVAESRNIVDVINQEDSVEGFSSSAKLGQPMIQLAAVTDKGDFDFFVLPGFREATYAGEDGRPRPALPIATDQSSYESNDGNNHVDFAARYSHAINEWDVGLSWFNGTSRQPQLNFNPSTLSLTPFYYQVQQLSIDLQATLESWLLKLELGHRSGKRIENHIELVSGFEYSFYSIADSNTDIGLVFEYLYDERGEQAGQPMQNDVLAGVRIALNDEQSSEALFGIIADIDGGGQIITLEASRRIGNAFKASLEASTWVNTDDDPILNALRNEDYVQFTAAWFF